MLWESVGLTSGITSLQPSTGAERLLGSWGANGEGRSPFSIHLHQSTIGAISMGSSPILNTAHLLEAQTQIVEASLSLDDDFNPTRFQRFQDDYILEIERTGSIKITLESTSFDPFLQVIDPLTGAVLNENDDGGEGFNSRLNFSANSGDRVWVRATSYWRKAVGDYRLTTTIQFDENSNPSSNLSPTPQPESPAGSSSTEAPSSETPPISPTPVSSTPSSPTPGSSAPENPPVSSSEDALQQRLNTIVPIADNFNAATGYGLINAGAAVAAILGNDPSDLPERGGLAINLEQIQAPEAWAQGATGEGIVVAVIDSGLDIDHPDLQGSIWNNPNEIAGDGIDNDDNGYIDDIHGWNFGIGQNNGDIRPGTSSSFQSHGTHVAGIIAANDDGVGNTGVAHNAQIMALRLGDTTFSGNFRNAGNLIDAIYYAVNNGANIINLSLGWSDSPELREALVYAAENDVVTVSASGNSSGFSPVVPARFADQWGISVGAVDQTGMRLPFSNRAGRDSNRRHVMAPGSEIYSTDTNDSYRRRSGTSMATPFASGAIALMLSANPDLTAEQVRNILTATSGQSRQ